MKAAATGIGLPTAGCLASGNQRAAAVIARSVRRSKQNIARKELQKRAKQEYLRRMYETADRIEDDQLVFELQPSSPRMRAELQESGQHAALNRQLAQQIPQLDGWQQLQDFVTQHAASLNFLNVVAVVTRAAALQQEAVLAAAAAEGPDHAPLVSQLTVLVLQQSSWFQPVHFAASAVALADLGVREAAVWANLTAAAQHKVGAFTFPQLAATLEALAAVGYTPELSWIERTYRQAGKHLHAADAADVAVLMGAWGELGYTPRDRLFLNQVKIITRRAFQKGQLSGAELVALLHGLARMPRYAPNQGWLAAAARAAQRYLPGMAPGAVVDLLLSFVALDFSPPEAWMDAALARLQQAMQAFTEADQQQHLSTPSSQQQQQQWQQQLLFLPPLDLQQLAWEQQLLSPGLLVDPDGPADPTKQQQQQQVLPVAAEEVQELQALFDEAEAEFEEGEGMSNSDELGPKLSQQQQQLGESDRDAPRGAAEAQQQGVGLDSGSPTPRLSSSVSSRSDTLSLRRQLLQPQLAAEHLGVLCWCLGRLQFQPGREWMQQLGQVLLLLLLPPAPLDVPADAGAAAGPGAAAGSGAGAALSQEVLLDVLMGCVAAGYLPVGPLQQQLLALLLQSVPTLPPEGLRRTCQVLVGLEAGLQEYQQQPTALAFLLQQQQQQQSSDILEPLMRHRDELAAALTHRQGIVLQGSSTAQLADVLSFTATAGQAPSLDYMSAAVSRAVAKLPDGCPTPAVVRLLWSLARMGFKPHPQLLHQLLAVLQRGLHLLSSQDLADAGWALCTLRHRPGNAWLALYLKEVAAKARHMQPQALTDALWALACFAAQPDREWLKLVAQAAGARAASGALTQQNAAVVVWALQQLGFRPEEVVVGVGRSLAEVRLRRRAVWGLLSCR